MLSICAEFFFLLLTTNFNIKDVFLQLDHVKPFQKKEDVKRSPWLTMQNQCQKLSSLLFYFISLSLSPPETCIWGEGTALGSECTQQVYHRQSRMMTWLRRIRMRSRTKNYFRFGILTYLIFLLLLFAVWTFMVRNESSPINNFEKVGLWT